MTEGQAEGDTLGLRPRYDKDLLDIRLELDGLAGDEVVALDGGAGGGRGGAGDADPLLLAGHEAAEV